MLILRPKTGAGMRLKKRVRRFIKRSRQLKKLVARGLKFGLADEIGWFRWMATTRGGRRLPRYREVPTVSGGLDYSRDNFGAYCPLARTRWPLLLLAAIPGQAHDEHGQNAGGRLLIIGPRFEGELFLAEGLGWKAEHIFALDLLSYSPRVTEGDMHAMPFPDGHFASIVCGWTLSYSKEPLVAAGEIDRVCAPGGVIVFGVEVADRNRATELDIPVGENRIQSLNSFKELLPGYSVMAHFPPEQLGNLVIALQKPALTRLNVERPHAYGRDGSLEPTK